MAFTAKRLGITVFNPQFPPTINVQGIIPCSKIREDKGLVGFTKQPAKTTIRDPPQFSKSVKLQLADGGEGGRQRCRRRHGRGAAV
ncbi:unnamed protein product [Vitrella brassicaformis CCMP3155]|uniref:Uncharacterized protein n=1 Tax=Vitrella brassicaformis (strain CCMP3155) TaxID=1169540 RepID=A0A0G4ED13_VITBC|nr:unnamed protein product [Vitrella brassicaformis CCMP3155]|mmetsp:Transcript_1329/g.3471  ORF Transcript_1329/g.3471 Transcript_1329/m.3471 type:complete len:86 (+) Transcript_1329:275-532(+)|eukprot:CEL93885.1 unnamed protein product [Vitrella brassicaformis CCMP3155]